MATRASSGCQRSWGATSPGSSPTRSRAWDTRAESSGPPGPMGITSTCSWAGSANTCSSKSSKARSKKTRRMRPLITGPRAAAKASSPSRSVLQPQLSESQIISLAQLSVLHRG